MSAPQEGDCIKVFPIATALARAYNCLLLPGLGVTACLSPADSKLMTHDEEKESAYCCSSGREKIIQDLYIWGERVCQMMWPCFFVLCKKKNPPLVIFAPVLLKKLVWEIHPRTTSLEFRATYRTRQEKKKVQRLWCGFRKQLWALLNTISELSSSSIYLHVFQPSSQLSADCYASVVTGRGNCGPNRKWHQIRCSVISASWVGENVRVKGREKKDLIGGKRKQTVFRSQSVSVAQTSQTLWSC